MKKKGVVITIALTCLLVIAGIFAFLYFNKNDTDNDIQYKLFFSITSLDTKHIVECEISLNEGKEHEDATFYLEFYDEAGKTIKESEMHNNSSNDYIVVVNKNVYKKKVTFDISTEKNIQNVKVKKVEVK